MYLYVVNNLFKKDQISEGQSRFDVISRGQECLFN